VNIHDIESRILVTSAVGIAPILAQEIKALGLPVVRELHLGVLTTGTMHDAIRLNLQLRTGLRVLFLLHEFSACNGDDLYKELVRLSWEKWIPKHGYVSVTGSVVNDTIKDTRYANLRVKDAIVDRCTNTMNSRPDSGPDRSRSVVFLHWRDQRAAIYLDTSGEPLSRRGYRKIPGKAPMQECLSAATVLASRWKPDTPFINPMCGSGTVGIEAAMIALNKAPGLLRSNYGFMHIIGYDKDFYQEHRKILQKETLKKLPAAIEISDIDANAISGARKNAVTAGVDHLLDFRIADFREIEIPEENGTVFLNPPYGMRIDEEKRLEGLYKQIGDFFKQSCSGYWCYIFTGNLKLAKQVGLKTKRRMEFYNGSIESRLLEYEMYDGSRKKKYLDDNPQTDE